MAETPEDPLAAVLAATEAARALPATGSEAQAIAKVDAMIALLTAAIRNHPQFVALEAAWRVAAPPGGPAAGRPPWW
jgi:type VI secretion system protein ImpC